MSYPFTYNVITIMFLYTMLLFIFYLCHLCSFLFSSFPFLKKFCLKWFLLLHLSLLASYCYTSLFFLYFFLLGRGSCASLSLLRSLWGQNYFHSNTKSYLHFPSVYFTNVPWGFWEDICHVMLQQIKGEGDLRIFLLRPTLRKFAKCEVMTYFSLFFVLLDIVIFHKNMSYIC